MSDGRYIEFAAVEQRVLRSGLLIVVSVSTLISIGVLFVTAKDYFGQKNICCVESNGPCASFLIRSCFGVMFSSISLYVGSGQLFVDYSISTLVSSIVNIVVSFFALIFSLMSLRMRLTTNRHLIILENIKKKQRKEINNAGIEEKKSRRAVSFGL